jgi:PTS system fructose-specific IIC component
MIAELLNEKSISLSMAAVSKEEAIGELVDLLVRTGRNLEKDSLFSSALEREGRLSTSLGKGVAVPRCRADIAKEISCSVGLKHGGIDFDALDGIPVEIFFMIAAPRKSDDTYVQVLSRLYRILNQETFRSNLLKAKTARDVISLVSEEEKELDH